MGKRTTPEFRQRVFLLALFAAVALVFGAIWWWWWPHDRVPTLVGPAEAPSSATAAAVAPPASAPAIRFPIEAVEAAASAPESPDLGAALNDLFGRDAVLKLFELDEFPRRVVATVDNLGRSQLGARLRPLRPAGGKFTVQRGDGGDVIGADNGLRYTPYVLLMENVDLRRAVAAYARLYPAFQHAYEELGYPRGYFNDRLVEVIDLMLATPERSAPLRVRLPAMAGHVQPARPWVLYEFEDPELQTLAAGQKLLLRMGPVNERRIKSRLRELRRLLTEKAAPR